MLSVLEVVHEGADEVPCNVVVQLPLLPLGDLSPRRRTHRCDGRVITGVVAPHRWPNLRVVLEDVASRPAPVRMPRLLTQCRRHIERRRILRGLRARVRDVARSVEVLGRLHGHDRRHAHARGGGLEQLHRVQANGPPHGLLLSEEALDHGLPRLPARLLNAARLLLVESRLLVPGELAAAKPGHLDRDLRGPVGLPLEGLDLVMPLHAEPQSRRLARPVGDDLQIAVELLPAVLHQRPREQPRERDADLQV
mmetsp:Transcript_67449/g.173710  ORF Transcript_67449/g.173710 Transcript_67449/m.173710 type:complete len:252 (-) Transcript_67449:982-1737(-)